MANDRFVYTLYIRANPAEVFEALTAPAFTRRYWFGTTQQSDWQVGSPWKLLTPDGRVGDAGEILEIDPPRRLVLSWRVEMFPELNAEGFTQVAFELAQVGLSTRLTVIQEIPLSGSKTIAQMSEGWPHILASLKSLLETGAPLAETEQWPDGV